MSNGQLLNLQRLERHYLQTLSKNGMESPLVLQAAIEFAQGLLREGQLSLKSNNATQAEGYFMRAKEITTPISMVGGVFYSTSFLLTRGQAILQLTQLYERQQNYQRACYILREVLPYLERFAYNKRQNLQPDDVLTLRLYCTLLYHSSENSRMIKKKDDMLDYCNKLVEIFTRLNITYEGLQKLSKEEFQKVYKKQYSMLARAFYQIGKSQCKVGFEKAAVQNLHRAAQISELVFGPDDVKTIKCRDKYMELSQKMEFDMVMGDEPIDFHKFKTDIYTTTEQADTKLNQSQLKNTKGLNHRIIQQVKNYQQIVNTLTRQSSRYSMPEYVKKVREDYEQRLVTMEPKNQDLELAFNKYKITRNKPSLFQSRAASTYMNQNSMLNQDKIFSPQLSLAAQSNRVSNYIGSNDRLDQLKEHLKNVELKSNITDMLIMRPQVKSEHVKVAISALKTKESDKVKCKPVEKDKLRIKSARHISKVRQPTQIFKTESHPSEVKLTVPLQEHSNIQDEEMHSARLSLVVTPTNLRIPTQPQLFQSIRTEQTISQISYLQELYENNSQEVLDHAANLIIGLFRRILRDQYNSQCSPMIGKPVKTITSFTQFSDKDSVNIPMKNSMKNTIRQNFMKSSNKGQLLKNKATIASLVNLAKNESELTQQKATKLVQLELDVAKQFSPFIKRVGSKFLLEYQISSLNDSQLQMISNKNRDAYYTNKRYTKHRYLRIELIKIYDVVDMEHYQVLDELPSIERGMEDNYEQILATENINNEVSHEMVSFDMAISERGINDEATDRDMNQIPGSANSVGIKSSMQLMEDSIRIDGPNQNQPILRQSVKKLTINPTSHKLFPSSFLSSNKLIMSTDVQTPGKRRTTFLLKKENLGPPIQEDQFFMQEYFSDFPMASQQNIDAYKQGSVLDIHFPNFRHDLFKGFTYFFPQGEILEPEYVEYEDECINSQAVLCVVIKKDVRFVIGMLIIQNHNLYLLADGQKLDLDIKYECKLLPNKSKLQSLKEYIQSPPVVVEQNDNDWVQEELIVTQLQRLPYRYMTLLINRCIPRCNHYHELTMEEQYDAIVCSNTLQFSPQELLEFHSNSNSVRIISQIYIQDSLIEDTSTMTTSTVDDFAINTKQIAVQQPQFSSYMTPFKVINLKHYVPITNVNGRIYYRIQLCLKQQQQYDSQLLYLQNQQVKEQEIYLKKELHTKLHQDQVMLKLKVYNTIQRTTSYQYLTDQKTIEKVTHILCQGGHMKQKLLSLQAQFMRGLNGKTIRCSVQRMSLEERNQDKYSELDQFLLLYISDPYTFVANLNASQVSLKSTMLFYFFKQQLKLTLISSDNQRFFMRTYFNSKKFYSQSQVSNMGRVMVETYVYQFNPLYLQTVTNQENTYFFFQIFPHESRTKIFKLVLDLADIVNLVWSKVTSANCFKDTILYEIVKRLTSYLICYRTNTYNGVKLPLSFFEPQANYDLLNTFKDASFGTNLLLGYQIPQESVDDQSTPKYKYLITDQQIRKKHSLNSGSQNRDRHSSQEIEDKQLPPETSRILTNNSMLTPIYRGKKVIYKQIKRINKTFLIVTVSYLLAHNSFQLAVYMPMTCRYFLCHIKQSDFANMDASFLETIYPSQLVTKGLLEQFFVNRWKFNEITKMYNVAMTHPDDFEEHFNEAKGSARAIPLQELQKLTESKISINEDEEENFDQYPKMLMIQNSDDSKNNSSESQNRAQGRSSTQPPHVIKKQFTKQLSNLSLPMRKSVQLQVPVSRFATENKSHFFKLSPRGSGNNSVEFGYNVDKDEFFEKLLIRKNNLDVISSFEIKIWEQIVDKITIIKNENSIYILKLNTFKGVLRETLHSSLLYLGNEDNVNFEVFVSNKLKPSNIFKPLMPIRLTESTKYQLYLRITYLDKPIIVNLKMMLRKPLHQYYNDERLNLQNANFRTSPLEKYEFILSDLQKCSIYVLNKLKKNYARCSEFPIDEIIGDSKCPQVIKVNVDSKIQQKMIANKYEYVLLIRSLFTYNPTQMIAIFYRERRQRFYLFIWNTENAKTITIKQNLAEVQVSIPNVLALLELKLYFELGNRILKSQKNKLLIQTYSYLI